MNDLIKPEKEEKDYVEAELLDGKYQGQRREKNYTGQQQASPKNGSFFFKALEGARKTIFTAIFLVSFILIFIGALLSMTGILAIIGIPMILIGLALLFIGIRLFSGKIIIR